MQKIWIADDKFASVITEDALRKEYKTDTEYRRVHGIKSFKGYIKEREEDDISPVDFGYEFQSALASNIWEGALREANTERGSQSIYQIVSLYLCNDLPHEDWLNLCSMLWVNEVDLWDFHGELLRELRDPEY